MIDLELQLDLPVPLSYRVWQPWLRDYHGEDSVGYVRAFHEWAEWVWYDQDMKAEMTGR